MWDLEMRYDTVILYRWDKFQNVVSVFSDHRDSVEVSRLVVNAMSYPNQSFLPMFFQLEKKDINLGY